MSKSKQGENLRPPINYVQSICLLSHNPQLHNSCIVNFGQYNWSEVFKNDDRNLNVHDTP